MLRLSVIPESSFLSISGSFLLGVAVWVGWENCWLDLLNKSCFSCHFSIGEVLARKLKCFLHFPLKNKPSFVTQSR